VNRESVTTTKMAEHINRLRDYSVFIKQLQTNLTSLSDESLFLQKYLDINYQTKFTYRSNMADFINLKTRGKSIFGACAREKLLLQEFGGGIYND